MKIGYARVSTNDQETNLQTDALKRANCDLILEEKASGGSLSRPILLKLLKQLKAGDVIVIYKLDRMTRNVKDLLTIAARLEKVNAKIVSLTEPIDTTNPMGRMLFQLLGVLAEFERAVIRERTNAGLEAARARGRIGGRPSPVEKQSEKLLELWRSGKYSKTELAQKFETHISSIKRLIARHGAQQSRPTRTQLELLP
jgi:DNA invertase Pin-like site-specific DNA recombinase